MPRPLIADRRLVILDRAEALISAGGYAATSIARIASESGIGKGAVYREFPSKEALLEALLTRSMLRLVEAMAETIDDAERRGISLGLADIYRVGIDGLRRHPLLVDLVTTSQGDVAATVRDRPDDRYADRFAWVLEYLAALQEAGVVRRDLAVPEIATTLSALTVGFLTVGSLIGSPQSAVARDTGMDVVVAMVAALETPDATAGPAATSGAAPDPGLHPTAAHQAHRTLLDRIRRQLHGDQT